MPKGVRKAATKPTAPAGAAIAPVQPQGARRIVFWPLARLVPYPRNARTHTEAQIAKLASLIAANGFTNPIQADENGMILAGHARHAAATRLGLARVPVIQLLGLSELQKRAMILADNRSALDAGWDEEMLKIELGELRIEGYDLDMTGFSERDIAALLEPVPGDGSGPEDEAPGVEKVVVSRLGDLWVCGPHRILCGSALSPEDVDRLMGGVRARMVFTDPPWNVAIGQDSNPRHRQRKGLVNDSLPQAEFSAFLEGAALAVARVVTGDVYLVMSSSQWPVIDAAMRGAGLHWSGTVVWVKDSFVLGRSNYHRRFEPIWYGWKNPGKSSFGGRRDLDDVWQFPRPHASEEHPSMKPVALVQMAIENSSSRGNIVADLFGGSGSTMIAAQQAGRRCFSMELAPEYRV